MNPQILLFNNFFIKNGSHDTIYTFENYFVTMFFSFQLYPNENLISKRLTKKGKVSYTLDKMIASLTSMWALRL